MFKGQVFLFCGGKELQRKGQKRRKATFFKSSCRVYCVLEFGVIAYHFHINTHPHTHTPHQVRLWDSLHLEDMNTEYHISAQISLSLFFFFFSPLLPSFLFGVLEISYEVILLGFSWGTAKAARRPPMQRDSQVHVESCEKVNADVSIVKRTMNFLEWSLVCWLIYFLLLPSSWQEEDALQDAEKKVAWPWKTALPYWQNGEICISKVTFSMQMGWYFPVLDYKRAWIVHVTHLSGGFSFSCHCLLIYLWILRQKPKRLTYIILSLFL